MKIYRILLFIIILFCFEAKSQEIKLQKGDFIFQNLHCGSLCDAINAVTSEVQSFNFNHMGLVVFEGEKTFVIEASGTAVRKVSLEEFLSKSKEPHYVGRLTEQHQRLIDKAIVFAEKQLGVPYDDAFIYDNGKYYCSELIYDAFKEAQGGSPLFKLEPMSFSHPVSNEILPEWLAYYENLGIQVPEGELGCNPAGMANSEYVKLLGKL